MPRGKKRTQPEEVPERKRRTTRRTKRAIEEDEAEEEAPEEPFVPPTRPMVDHRPLPVLSPVAQRRLMKELESLVKNPVEFATIDAKDDNLARMIANLTGPAGTIYAGEHFVLQFTFPATYPIDSPEVVFLPPHVPMHKHIYSVGHICLSSLYDQWSPTLGIRGVLLSIISMLASSPRKERPADDADYARECTLNPKDTSWAFHDDRC
ncbi:putative Ubiquitin-conjugating enzyme E2 W [Paratrimastix pyriformis]|uniref:Ubiquitin-conjugating enzyme E2 W n=1 Tax=Paratrimastix pyriformis TaxID=342808 RepID=A0ABQ8UUR0_9EUKA|nr:putative Ubiquitin-conjugating enzyme E2 W [Paratrimastix pyriformis]